MRIGLIGYGGMGRHHAAQTAANPALQLVAISDPGPQARERAASDHQVPTFTTPEEMLKGADLDGVLIVAPTRYHAPLIQLAARAGKHVFSEKPLVLRPEEAPAVRVALEDSGIVFGFGLVLRYMPPYIRAKALIEGEELGLALLGHFRYGARLGGYSYVYDPEMGGGLLNEHTIHMIDAAEFLLGPISAVAAKLTSSPGCQTEDNAAMLLIYENGAGATLTGSGITHFTSAAEVTGTDGELAVIGNTRLERVTREGRKPVDLPEAPDPYYAEVEEWRQAIKEKRAPATGLREALRITALLAAIHRASRSGQVERVVPVA